MSANHGWTSDTAHAKLGLWLGRSFRDAIRDLRTAVAVWHQRARSRAHLRDLETHRLEDIGISPAQRACEARKPFWMR